MKHFFQLDVFWDNATSGQGQNKSDYTLVVELAFKDGVVESHRHAIKVSSDQFIYLV